ncbi:MAG: CoA-binding protein, partial [Terriglobales bacterium]
MSLPPQVVAILRQARTVAVVGLSANPARPSHGVARYLQHRGFRIVPVNPGEGSVLGEACFADLDLAAAAAGPLEVVDVFRRSEHVP